MIGISEKDTMHINVTFFFWREEGKYWGLSPGPPHELCPSPNNFFILSLETFLFKSKAG
jgi:hypothetical protein